MQFHSDYLYEYAPINLLSNIYIWLHSISIFWHPNYKTCNSAGICDPILENTYFAQNSKIELLVSRKRALFPLQNVVGCMLLQRLVAKIHAFSFHLSKMVFLRKLNYKISVYFPFDDVTCILHVARFWSLTVCLFVSTIFSVLLCCMICTLGIVDDCSFVYLLRNSNWITNVSLFNYVSSL